jgi:predicted phosphodiesterase
MSSSRKLTIQVYSDIHLDLIKFSKHAQLQINLVPLSKYLFLAGNICNLNHEMFFKFFDFCTTRWEKIFFTPGNQDFYSFKKNYGLIDFEYDLRLRERYKNVFYLNRGSVSLNDDIDVYGTVFWTYPSPELYVRDYNNIQRFCEKKKNNIPIDSRFMKELSQTDHQLLNSFLNTNRKKTIVVTHFPPTQDGTICNDLDKELKDHNAWNNNTIETLNLSDVLIWISGHTHFSYDIKHEKVRLISNQVGYLKEQGLTKSTHSGLFEIEYE